MSTEPQSLLDPALASSSALHIMTVIMGVSIYLFQTTYTIYLKLTF
jgi:hypothetical protein